MSAVTLSARELASGFARRRARAICHPPLLILRLDGFRVPGRAHLGDRHIRRVPQLDQKPGRDHAGAPDTSAAVNDDIGAVTEHLSQALVFKPATRCRNVRLAR